jgi:hypothetical protein
LQSAAGIPEESATPVPDDRGAIPFAHGPSDSRCLNCGTALVGAYCHRCGQEAAIGRVTWRTLLRAHYRALGRLDSEIFRTAWALARNPGRFCLEYLKGHRRGRTSPVSYFFVSFFASFVLIAAGRWAFPGLRAEEAPVSDLHTQLLVLTAAFVWAAAHRIVFRKAGYNLAEHAVCMLYLYGQLNVISAAVLVASAPQAAIWTGSATVLGVTSLVLMLGYFSYFGSRLYHKSMLRALGDTLAVTVVFLALFAPVFLAWIVVSAWSAAHR